MINWWDILTTLIGAFVVGVGGLLVTKVNIVLKHVRTFSEHIIECEARNEAHTKIHEIQAQAIDRRLTMLETMRGHVHDG